MEILETECSWNSVISLWRGEVDDGIEIWFFLNFSEFFDIKFSFEAGGGIVIRTQQQGRTKFGNRLKHFHWPACASLCSLSPFFFDFFLFLIFLYFF